MRIVKQLATVAIAILASTAIHAQAPPQAPAFSAKDADGKTHTLDQYKGKVVVLEFTNPGSPVTGKPGCPYMIPRYENKIMQNVAKKVQDAGGVYLAVNSNYYNTAADSKAVAQKYGVTHPTLIDDSGAMARAYHAKTTPHMFVIGKDGKVVYQGALDSNNSPDTGNEASSTQYVLDAVTAASQGKAPQVAQTQPYGCGIKLK
jgi:peroxiredoxin